MNEEEVSSSKLIEKMKANPAVPIGLIGLLGVVGYRAYNLKNKKGSLSLYIINTRVAAQTTLMAAISVGLLYSMITKHWHKFFPEKKN